MGHKVVTDPDKARERVRRYHEEGWDFIKIYTRLSPEVYAAIIDEAGKLDFPVAGHVPYPVVEQDYGLAQPLVTIEHTEEIFQGPLDHKFDEAPVVAVARQLKAMNATLTPTLLIFDHLVAIARGKEEFLDGIPMEQLNPLMKWFTDKTAGQRWLDADEGLTEYLERENEFLAHITRVLHEEGVELVAGSDCGVIYALPGRSTHDELRLMREAGIPHADVLRMATLGPAAVLGVAEELGSIEAGKVADAVLTETNPLQDISALASPRAVLKNGQWLRREVLEDLEKSAARPSSFYLTFGRMLEFLLFA